MKSAALALALRLGAAAAAGLDGRRSAGSGSWPAKAGVPATSARAAVDAKIILMLIHFLLVSSSLPQVLRGARRRAYRATGRRQKPGDGLSKRSAPGARIGPENPSPCRGEGGARPAQPGGRVRAFQPLPVPSPWFASRTCPSPLEGEGATARGGGCCAGRPRRPCGRGLSSPPRRPSRRGPPRGRAGRIAGVGQLEAQPAGHRIGLGQPQLQPLAGG